MKRHFYAIAILISVAMSSCSSLANLNASKALEAGTAAATALTISDAQVVQLCKEYMTQTDAKNIILPSTNAYSQRLAKIMSKFKNISGLNVNYAVYQSSTVNAFACGDGSVRVYSGLMDVMDDEEVFAVIGHELGHLKNKDTRDAYRNAYLMVAARYGISAINSTAGIIAEGMVGDIAQQLASNAYSRKQEYEADDAALQFCLTNNVNPYAMYNSLNVLLSLEGSSNAGTSSSITQMFSTHPDTAKRAARAKSNAAATGKSGTIATKTTKTSGTGSKTNISNGTKTGTKVSAGTSNGKTTGTKTVKMNNTGGVKVKTN